MQTMVVTQRRLSRLVSKHHLALLAAALLWSGSARADILFEGYSKVLLDGAHVGYVVQRYEFDNKKQEFISAYYLKTNQVAGNITESLKARATSTLKPISYQFTSLSGDHAKTIDAQFKGDQMTAKVNDGGKAGVISKKIPKGAFLSNFLAYIMLQGKEGLKKGTKYSYQAIAEEDAEVDAGEAFISGEETVSGINAFKILNTFKSTQFVSYCTYKGEVIATRSPVQKISTELVASIKDATAGLSVNSGALTQLFGSVPRGVENPIARRGPEGAETSGVASPDKQKKLEATPPPSDSPKKEGFPGGQGVMLKSSPSGN